MHGKKDEYIGSMKEKIGSVFGNENQQEKDYKQRKHGESYQTGHGKEKDLRSQGEGTNDKNETGFGETYSSGEKTYGEGSNHKRSDIEDPTETRYGMGKLMRSNETVGSSYRNEGNSKTFGSTDQMYGGESQRTKSNINKSSSRNYQQEGQAHSQQGGVGGYEDENPSGTFDYGDNKYKGKYYGSTSYNEDPVQSRIP